MMLNKIQNLCLPGLICLLGLAPCALAAEIYKQVLPDGTVTYSSEPLPNAEKIDPPQPMVIPSLKSPAGAGAVERTQPIVPPYDRLEIMEPTDDQVIWSNEREVSVDIALEPALKVQQGHRLVILLDGSRVAGPADDTRFTIAEVDRGSHVLTAEVHDIAGRVLMHSAPVTIHLKQHSTLQPGRP
ncbi:MAG: DUF4124 domain-containing protein [Gammaproteobacteria bacterium]|nr:DUF4124 domain-containing protein [Gammaproteobacteria bacterium]